eukprot:scaffold9504_cov49-Attheya_sp.AAC.2
MSSPILTTSFESPMPQNPTWFLVSHEFPYYAIIAPASKVSYWSQQLSHRPPPTKRRDYYYHSTC